MISKVKRLAFALLCSMLPTAPALAADERRQFSGRAAPVQVHLEKSILCMQPAERTRDIDPIFSADGRHPQGIALDAYRRLQTAEGDRAVELRQARPQPKIKPPRGHRSAQ